MTSKRTLKTIIIMGLSSVIGYLVTFFLTPYITENIGIEAYGFVSIAKTFVGYGGIITTALTSFIVRYIALNYHKDNLQEAKSYYVSSINASVIMCLLLTVIFSTIIFNLEIILNIPSYLIQPVKLLFVFVFVSFVIDTVSNPFTTGFYVKNRLDLYGILKILSYIFEILTLVILFSFFYSSVWFVGVGSFISALTLFCGSILINKKLLPELTYKKNLYSINKVKLLLKNGLWNSINQLGNTLNSGLDLLVSNALLTGTQTGQIAIAKSMGAIFATLTGIIFQPLQPELLKTYSLGVNENFLFQLKKSMKLCGFVSALAFSGFFALGKLFYKLWLPTQNTNLLYILTLLTVFTYVMDIFLQPIYYVSTLTVKNKIPCFITIAGGLLNILGMYILIKYTELGVYSVPITTAVIMFCINFFFNPVYACWCLKIKRNYFYPLIFRHLFATFAMCSVFKLIALAFNPQGWFGLVINALIMIVAGVAIYCFITFNSSERIEIINTIRNKL